MAAAYFKRPLKILDNEAVRKISLSAASVQQHINSTMSVEIQASLFTALRQFEEAWTTKFPISEQRCSYCHEPIDEAQCSHNMCKVNPESLFLIYMNRIVVAVVLYTPKQIQHLPSRSLKTI